MFDLYLCLGSLLVEVEMEAAFAPQGQTFQTSHDRGRNHLFSRLWIDLGWAAEAEWFTHWPRSQGPPAYTGVPIVVITIKRRSQ